MGKNLCGGCRKMERMCLCAAGAGGEHSSLSFNLVMKMIQEDQQCWGRWLPKVHWC